MTEKDIKNIRVPVSISSASNIDDAVGWGIKRVERGEQEGRPDGRVDIIDTKTGKVVSIDSNINSNKSTGYTPSFGNAWDRMMARRAEREATGQLTTDD